MFKAARNFRSLNENRGEKDFKRRSWVNFWVIYVVYFLTHFNENNLDIFPTFLDPQTEKDSGTNPEEFFEAAFGSFLRIIMVLSFCFTAERTS